MSFYGDRMTRHEFREQIFRMLFGMSFHTDEEERRAALYNYLDETCEFELSEDEQKDIVEKIMDIVSYIPELDSDIDRAAEGWRTTRMGKAELTILRLALYEMRYDEAVPVGVAINEAVELSKEYCEDGAPAFINGILAKLARDTETKEATL